MRLDKEQHLVVYIYFLNASLTVQWLAILDIQIQIQDLEYFILVSYQYKVPGTTVPAGTMVPGMIIPIMVPGTITAGTFKLGNLIG